MITNITITKRVIRVIKTKIAILVKITIIIKMAYYYFRFFIN